MKTNLLCLTEETEPKSKTMLLQSCLCSGLSGLLCGLALVLLIRRVLAIVCLTNKPDALVLYISCAKTWWMLG